MAQSTRTQERLSILKGRLEAQTRQSRAHLDEVLASAEQNKQDVIMDAVIIQDTFGSNVKVKHRDCGLNLVFKLNHVPNKVVSALLPNLGQVGAHQHRGKKCPFRLPTARRNSVLDAHHNKGGVASKASR